MMEELKIGRAVQANPYVIQMDRFVQSLEKIDQGIFAAGEKT